MKKIVMTGGGSAGHVTPNLALIPVLQTQGWSIEYIGSEKGVERAMIEATHIPYHTIKTGKLRRYFSWQNVLDPFFVLQGIWQSYVLLRRIKPEVVFSKGGFVALPVVIGAWLARIPVVAHESDFSIGLANRLSFPFVNTICVTFPAARTKFKNPAKVMVTGTPIREGLLQGERVKGLQFCGFQADKPCLLVIGGGAGAQAINRCVRQALPMLLPSMQIIHICGPGKTDASLNHQTGYFQLEYAHAELADLFAASDWVVSRAGANALYELLVLAKPHILIPLPYSQSRGDQIENARYFEHLGASHVLAEEQLNPETLAQAIQMIQGNKEKIFSAISALDIQPAVPSIVKILEAFDAKT
jgi:UDP-N-acetylglucosamine--N-acetylmuramyl-(pentapeptide) pyrophosphoryl-undecaprenol N-acetylglucosamine transferase